MKKGEIVVKVIEGGGFRTCSIHRIASVKKGVAYLGDASLPDDVNAFDAKTGNAKANYIPGFSSYLVTLDDEEIEKINTVKVKE